MATEAVLLIRNSLATLIAWLSTCLLASGASMLFSDQLRSLWMVWGCFGLAAALGLEAVARVAENRRIRQFDKTIQKRFDRELQSVSIESEILAATRKAVEQVLAMPRGACNEKSSRRDDERFTCDLEVGVLLQGSSFDSESANEQTKISARLVNLSNGGFAFRTSQSLPTQQVILLIPPASGPPVHFLAEIRWCDSQQGETTVVGGRLIRVLNAENQ
jgi:hypothetical protein